MARLLRQPSLFPKPISQKQLKLFLLLKSLKRGCSDLYFQSNSFDMICKSFPYLTSLFSRGPVNPSTLTFGSINLTEIMTNLLVAWKINQKLLQ